MNRPAIVGAGSWGTALALVLARRGLPVRLWVHNPEHARGMARDRVNHSYLPGFLLPASIEIHADLQACLIDADSVTFAVPSHTLRQVLRSAAAAISPEAALISAAKGLEEHSLLRMSQVMGQVLASGRIAVISGPSFAREVASGQPTAVVAASSYSGLAEQVQNLYSDSRFRVYASSDVTGAELGGAVKNVIAIAAGVCHGLHLGANSVAALITRGLAEMSRLAHALGAQPQTLGGLTGLGDLVLTCTGELSRNRQVGIQLAEGRTLEQIHQTMNAVAEGVRTTEAVVQLGLKHSVSLPISEQMHAVLYARRSPREAIAFLMKRSLRGE